MKIGYARIPIDDQNLDLEMDTLIWTRDERTFTDQGLAGRLTSGKGYPGDCRSQAR